LEPSSDSYIFLSLRKVYESPSSCSYSVLCCEFGGIDELCRGSTTASLGYHRTGLFLAHSEAPRSASQAFHDLSLPLGQYERGRLWAVLRVKPSKLRCPSSFASSSLYPNA